MIPPEHAFKREANAQQASLSTLQKVVRYAEKDDMLLYMTAAFGVLMPGIMYFFYRYVHNRYRQSKKIRNQQARKRTEKCGRTTTIFYCGDIAATKEVAYELAENIHFDPLVAKLSAQELERARKPKAVHIFVISGDKKQGISSRLVEFMDWLDELKYERREKSYLRDTKFLLFYVAPENNSDDDIKTTQPFEKRLRSLEALPLGQSQLISEDKKALQEICVQLNDLLRRYNYGEFDTPGQDEDFSQEEYSEEDLSD